MADMDIVSDSEDNGETYFDPSWDLVYDSPELPREVNYNPDDPSPFDAIIMNRYCCGAEDSHLHRPHQRTCQLATLSHGRSQCSCEDSAVHRALCVFSQCDGGIATSCCIHHNPLSHPLFLEDPHSDLLEDLSHPDLSSSLDFTLPQVHGGTEDLQAVEVTTNDSSDDILSELLDLREEVDIIDPDELLTELAHLAEGDDARTHESVIGRQLAYIGDDINERYAPHFRRMAQMLVARRRGSSFTKQFLRTCMYHIWSQCVTSRAGFVGHMKDRLTSWLDGQRHSAFMGLNKCLVCFSQWCATWEDMQRNAKLSASGLLLVTVSLVTAAGLALLTWVS